MFNAIDNFGLVLCKVRILRGSRGLGLRRRLHGLYYELLVVVLLWRWRRRRGNRKSRFLLSLLLLVLLLLLVVLLWRWCVRRRHNRSRSRRGKLDAFGGKWRRRGLGEDFDGDARFLWLYGIEVAVGNIEASLGASVLVVVVERSASRHGRVCIYVMGMKALSSPGGAGDGGHWRE